jgi:16S rRNA (guanine1207-N2)-methyltransferase
MSTERNPSAKALFYAIETAQLELPEPMLFLLLTAQDVPSFLRQKINHSKSSVQFWTPYADQIKDLKSVGCDVLEDLPLRPVYGTVCLIAPKQKDELKFLLANACKLLQPDGLLMVAAENEIGGKTLTKIAAQFCDELQSVSKYKSRVVWSRVSLTQSAHQWDQALAQGSLQKNPLGFWSCPGLFSWDRLDKGTEILLQNLPFSLQGVGADFGAGFGMIGDKILSRYKSVEKLYCLENDRRALQACEKNLAPFNKDSDENKARVSFHHIDILDPMDPLWITLHQSLDFIVMNPPFHQGKAGEPALGQAFIKRAAQCLKKDGRLFFVANLHLPYEKMVEQEFEFQRVVSDTKNYKIIEAIK